MAVEYSIFEVVIAEARFDSIPGNAFYEKALIDKAIESQVINQANYSGAILELNKLAEEGWEVITFGMTALPDRSHTKSVWTLKREK